METISNEQKAKQTYPYYEDMNDIELVQANAHRIGFIAGCEWKDEQLADYLQQSWQRYKAAPTPTASAKRHLIERMANELGIKLKFDNPYIE